MMTVHEFSLFLPWAGHLKVRVETKAAMDILDIRAYAEFLRNDGRGSPDIADAIARKFGAEVYVLVVADGRRYIAAAEEAHNPYLTWSIGEECRG